MHSLSQQDIETEPLSYQSKRWLRGCQLCRIIGDGPGYLPRQSRNYATSSLYLWAATDHCIRQWILHKFESSWRPNGIYQHKMQHKSYGWWRKNQWWRRYFGPPDPCYSYRIMDYCTLHNLSHPQNCSWTVNCGVNWICCIPTCLQWKGTQWKQKLAHDNKQKDHMFKQGDWYVYSKDFSSRAQVKWTSGVICEVIGPLSHWV